MKWAKDYLNCTEAVLKEKYSKIPSSDCLGKVRHCGHTFQESHQNQCGKYIERMENGNINTSIGLREQSSGSQNKAFEGMNKCFSQLKQEIAECLPLLKTSCDSTNLRAQKVLKMNFDVVGEVMKKDPQVYVIHMIRDPRGILVSRQERKLFSRYARNIEEEATLLCHKMLVDIKKQEKLKEAYPSRIIQIKYEELAENATLVMSDIMSFLNREIPDVLKREIENIMHSNIESEKAFGVQRKNSSATANAWKGKMSNNVKSCVDRICSEVYTLTGYR